MAPTVYWGNGHYYEYVPSNQYWGSVEYDARQRSHQGLQGYLATVTSQGENDFIQQNSNNNAAIAGDAYLGGFWVNNNRTWSWKTGPENGSWFWENNAAVTGWYSNWQAAGRNGDGSQGADALQIWANNGSNTGKWDDTNSKHNYITEYGWSGPQFTVGLTGTPINGIENGTAARFTITADKFVASDYYDVRNTDGNTNALINIPITFGGTATLGVDYTVSYSNGLGGNGSNAYIKNGSSVDVIITQINDSVWESTKDVTVTISDNDTNNDTYSIAAGATTFQRAILSDDEPVLTMGNSLRKSIYFPYNDSSVSLDSLTAAYTSFDATINKNSSGFEAEGLVDNFAVRWQGYVKIQTTGQYVFTARGDDGMRLKVNNNQVINQWQVQGATSYNSAPIQLTAGSWVPVQLDYYQGNGGKEVSLSWTRPNPNGGTAITELIPSSSFAPYLPTQQTGSVSEGPNGGADTIAPGFTIYSNKNISTSLDLKVAAGSTGGANYSSQSSQMATFNNASKNALQLNGSTYLNVGNPSKLQLSAGTVEAWIKTSDAGSGDRNIFSKTQDFELKLVNNKLTLYNFSGGVQTVIQPDLYLNDNRWHHVALAFGSGSANVYVDGKQVGTNNYSYSSPNPGGYNLTIGGWNGYSQPTNASFDEVRIWNRKLTGDEIKTYNTYPLDQGNLPSGLVAYFPLDEGSGSTVFDKTANPSNATIVGTPIWAGPVQASANNQGFAQLGGSSSRVGDNYMLFANQTDANNKNNPLGGTGISTVSITTAAQSGQNFLSLNGTNQYATLPQQSFGGPLTIESWVKINSYTNWSRIIDLGNGPGQHNIFLGQFESSGKLTFQVFDGSGNEMIKLISSTQMALNEWTHVAATIDGQRNVKLYINGAVVDTGVTSSLPPIMQRSNNYVGRSNWGSDAYFNGSIDELRIYNTARTADTIRNDRYNTVNPGDSTLVYAYSFNSSSSNQSPSNLTGASGASLLNGASIGSSAAVDGSPAANNLWLRVLGDAYAKPNQQIQLDLVDNAYGNTADGYTVVGSPNSLTINDSAPVVSILSKVDPTEGSLGYVDLSFDKPVTSAAGIKVKYTLSGNASAGQDYLYPTARLSTDPNSSNYTAQNIVYFRAGSTGGRIYLPGVQDAVAEGLETIQLTLVDNVETNSNNFTYTGYSVAANASQTTLNLKDSGYYAPGVAITAQGKTGTAALRFNGTSDRLRTSISEAATNTSREIVFRTSSANGGLYQLNANATSDYLGLYLQNGNLVSKLGANSQLSTTARNYADNNWHRVLVTVGSNGGHCLYVDGQLVASNSAQTSASGGPFTSSFVGYNGNGGSASSYFNGDIRSLRNWDQELTSNHATGLPTTLPAAKNWLDFNSNRIVDYTAAAGSLASSLTVEGSLQTVTTTQVRATSSNTAALQLKLTSQPTDSVTMVITATNATVASGASLTFTSSNWDTAQTVNLTGISSSQQATITASASSSDSNYNRSSTLTVLPFGWSGSQQLDLVEGGPVVAIVPIASISATNNSVEGPTKADKSGFDIVFTDPVATGGGELLFTLNQGLTGNGIAKVDSKEIGAILSGGILQLDGTANGYAALPSKLMGGALTIEAWVNVKQYTNWARIIDLGNGVSNNNIILGFETTTCKPMLQLQNETGSYLIDLKTNVALQLGQWTHVAATIDANKLATIYINGVSVGTGTATALPATLSRTSNLVGKSNNSNDAGFNGLISDLRVYSGARTADQISADRYSAVNNSDSTLTYAYSFNNTANSSLSGSSNGAPVLYSGATLIPGADIDVHVDHTYRPLQFGGANNQSLDLPNKTIGGDLSIEAWVNLSAYASNGTIADIGSGSTTDNITLGFDGATGSPVFRLFNGSTKILELKSTTSYVPLNQWSHVAATIDSNRLATLYINGVAVASATASAAASSLLRSKTRIGNTVVSSAPLNGSLRDLNIYDVCRTSAQIKQDLYTSPSQSLSTGNNPSLLWSYALNNSTNSRFSSTSTGEVLVNGSFASTPTYGIMLDAGSQTTSVALTAVDNSIAQGNRTVQINVLPSADYGISTTSTSTFTLSDNDEAGLELAVLVNDQANSNSNATWSPLSDGNYKITVSEADRQGSSITRHTIGVRLKSQPLATVLVQIPTSTSNAVDVYNADTIVPFAGLTFTPGDWSTYKKIDVVGKDDGQAAGDRNTYLSFSLSNSSDTTYQSFTSGVDVLTSNADTLAISSGLAAQPDSTGTVAFLSTTPGGSIGELGSLVLDGSNTGYATLPSKSIGGALTIEAWVNVKSYTNWSRIIDFGNGAGIHNIVLGQLETTGKLFFHVYDGSGNRLVNLEPTTQIALNEWTHVAATIDDQKNVKLYMNGAVIGTAVASSLPVTLQRSNNYVGRSNWGGDNAYLNGSIADLRLYSGARTAEQINTDRYSAVNASDSSLTYAYAFNGTATSSRSGDSAATQFSGASLVGGGAMGLNFDGSTSKYGSLVSKSLGGVLTIEAWVNIKQYTYWARIVDLGNGAGNSNIILGFETTTGKPMLQLQDGAGSYLIDLKTNVPLQLGQWTHVAATIDANKLATIYINGVSVGTGTATALPATLSRTSNLIGKSNNSNDAGFNGTIRDLRIYSAVRSVEQINSDRFNAISADDSLVYGYDLVNSATSATNPSEVATVVGSTFGPSTGNTGNQTFTVSLKQARSTDTQVYFQLDGTSKERIGSDLIINESSRSTSKGLNEFIFDNYVQQTSSDQLQASSFSRRQVDSNGINETYTSTYANASSPLKYALRWTGFVYIPTDGYYVFKSKSDSGIRLTINNQLLIDHWHNVTTSATNPSTTYIADSLYLTGGTYVPIVYDYFDSNTASANTSIAQLWWQRPNPAGVGTTDELIPANHFSVNGLDSVLIPANSTSASFSVSTVDNLIAQKNDQLTFSLLSNPGIKIKAGSYTQTGGQTTIKLKLDGAYQDSLALSSGTVLDFRVDDGQSVGSVVNSITLTSDVTLFNGFEVSVTGTHANTNAFTTTMAAAYRPVTYRPNLNVVATSAFTNTGLSRQLFAGYTDPSKGLYALVPTTTATDSNGINETDASFAPLSPTDNFAARWTGYIKIPSTGTYRFRTVADNGVRLYVDGTNLIDNWTASVQRSIESTAQNYTQGQLVAVTMDYYSTTGTSTAQLQWSYSGTGVTTVTNQVIPDSAFSQLSGTIGLKLNESDASLTRSLKAGDALQFSNGTSLRVNSDVTLSTTATAVSASLSAIAPEATVSSGATLSLPAAAGAQVTVIDNDRAGFRITSDAAGLQTVLATDSFSINEADSNGPGLTRYLALKTQPTKTVTVFLESAATNHALLKDGSSSQAQKRIPLTFTASNWSTPQAFSVIPQRDQIDTGNVDVGIFATATSDDSFYNSLKPESNGKVFTINKVDMDVPAIVTSAVSVATGQGSNSNGSFTVSLSTKPTANVNVTLHPADGQFTVNNASINNDQVLVFTPTNWNIPQQVQVQAVANNIVQDTTISQQQLKSSSSDASYTNLTTADVSVVITHNTLPTVRLELVSLSEATAENGKPASWRLVSNAPVPSSWGSTGLVVGYGVSNALSSANLDGNATESVSINSLVQGLNSSGTIRIAPGQTTSNAFIMPIDDFAVDGVDKTFQLNLQAGSGYYLDPSASTATITIKDDDVAGIMIVQAGERTMAVEGATASQFQVCLLSQPSSTVTVSLADISTAASGQSGTPISQLTINNPTLTFTKDNWNVLQVVNVVANDDNRIEDGTGSRLNTGIHTGQIQYSFTSNDTNYASAGKADNHFTKTRQDIDILDRPLDPATYQGLDQALTSLMDGLNALSLPMVGNLKGKVGLGFNEFLDKLIDSIRTTPQLTSKKLEKLLKDSIGVGITVDMTMDTQGLAISFGIQDQYALYSIPLAADFAIPAFGFQTKGAIDGTFNYAAVLKMGVDKQKGFYLDTNNTTFTANYKTGLSDNFSLTGGLGYLQLDAVNKASPHTGSNGASMAGLTGEKTGMDASFTLTLNSPYTSNAASPFNVATKVDVSKLLSTNFSNLFQYSFSGNAALSLGVTTSVGGSSVIPSFSFDLSSIMPLFDYTNKPDESTSAQAQSSNIFFDNIKLDMGSFVTGLIRPSIAAIDGILKPIYPIINALYADTYVFSKLGIASAFDGNGDGKASTIELARFTANLIARLNPGNPKALQLVQSIDNTIEFCDTLKGVIDLMGELSSMSKDESYTIDFGSYTLPNFNASSDNPADSTNNKDVNNQSGTLASSQSTSNAAKNKTGRGAKLSQVFNNLKDLGFQIPLIEDPANIIKLLFGQNVDLFTWQLPSTGLSSSVEKVFPIYGALYGVMRGGYGMSTDLSFGFDTAGIQQWSRGGFNLKDSYQALDGFYVATGRPQLTFEALMEAGLGLGGNGIRVDMTGGLLGTAEFELLDPGGVSGTSDGKLRGSEIAANITNPLNLFQLTGQIAAVLNAQAQIGIDAGTFTYWMTVWKQRLATIPIFKFGIGGSYGSGQASNSYLQGSTVFFDGNFNGIIDPGEPTAITSQEDGSYSLEIDNRTFDTNHNGTIDSEEGMLVVYGGVDSVSQAPIRTPFVAPYGAMVTPLTSLYAYSLIIAKDKPGFSEEAVKSKIQHFFLLGNYDFLNRDPEGDLLQAETADGNSSFLLTPEQKITAENAYIAHIKLHLASFYLEVLGENVLPNIFPNDLPNKLKLNKELYSQIITYIEASDAQDPTGSNLSISTVNGIFPAIADGMIAYISQATTDQRSIATVKSLLANISSRSTLAFNELDIIAKAYEGKEFFNKINEIKTKIFNGITSEMASAVDFYQSVPGTPTMSNGARIDPSNPISFKPSNAIKPDPTITKTNVKLNDTMIDFTAILDGIGKRTSLGLNLKVVGGSLLSKLDPNRTGIQDPDKQLAYFAIDAAGNTTPFTYSPNNDVGARFYDLNGFGMADFVHLSYVDGGPGDMDGVKDGKISDPSSAAVVDSTPSLHPLGTKALQIGDLSINVPTALFISLTLKSNSSDLNHVGYLVLNQGEDPSAVTLGDLLKKGQTLFSSLGKTSSLPMGDTLLKRNIQLTNNQKLLCFETKGTTLQDLASGKSNLAELGSQFKFLTWNAQEGSKTANLNSDSGLSIELNLNNSAPGLNALISCDQSFSPVLNTTALAGDKLTGVLTYNREANYDSTVGFYQVLDQNGSLFDSITGRTLDPTALQATDQTRYRELALSSANRATSLAGIATINGQLAQKDFSLTAGSFYAPFAVVANTEQTYFAFAAVNTDGVNHFKMMGANVFGLEDLHGGGDRDYNDLLVGIDFKNYVPI
jgi:hypothetical protein